MKPPDGKNWAFEIKLDGYRIQARIDQGQVQMLTRSGLDWTSKFAIVQRALRSLPVSTAILDGELIVQDNRGVSRFSDLVSDIRHRRSDRMTFVAFDLLFLDGANMTKLPLMSRKASLKKLFDPTQYSHIRFGDHITGDGSVVLASACKLRAEGVICKRLDKPYKSARASDWLKIKCVLTDEFVIAGYIDSRVQDEAVGALVVGYFDNGLFRYAGRVGSGFSVRSAHALWTAFQPLRCHEAAIDVSLTASQSRGVHWIARTCVAQVKYLGWTSQGLLRHATFVALRSDKKPGMVTRPEAIKDR